jgi:branched-chain amino acid transport system permease protein
VSWLQSIIDALALGAQLALVAMGIGLVFGVLRIINFAQGELITAGAYALLLTNDLPVAVSIVVCFVVVIAFSLAMEFAYRPLRRATPAASLVATFAVSFTLQSIALLVFGSQGEAINFLPKLNQAVEIGDLRIRWITITTICVGALLLAAMALFLSRTDLGLQMRAAAVDFQTARVLGVRARRVIVLAFVLAGALAACVTLLVSVQNPLATPNYGFFFIIPGLVGVVVGGMDRLVAATLGGFAIGFATSFVADRLPADSRAFLTSYIFSFVIIVLLVRPNGLFARQRGAERL